MNAVLAALHGAASTEEIFGVLDLPFDQARVNVNRLHILKRFNQYLAGAGGLEGMGESEAQRTARELLERAYRDFLHASAVEQKVFKVFRQGSVQRISVQALRGSRASSGAP